MSRVKEMLSFLKKPVKELTSNKRFRKISNYNRYVKSLKIKKNTFLLESYHAVNMTGNVYALFNQLVKQNPSGKYYWVVIDLTDPMIPYIQSVSKNVTMIEYESKSYFKLLATCEYLLNDTSFMPYFIKREKQIYINTWHGTPLKTLGLDIKDASIHGHKNIQRNLLHTDILLMPNKFTADHLIQSHGLSGIFPGKVFVTGNPRVDNIFSENSNSDAIFSKYELPKNKKVVLFAPTWKKSIDTTTDDDIEALLSEVNRIQAELEKDSIVLLKAHYFIYEKFVQLGHGDKVVPNWVDTNELLSVVDRLITDYSSIFFDFLPLKKPIYFYIPDKLSYEATRGFYLDLDTLPGIVTTNLGDIISVISQDNELYLEQYKSKLDTYLEEFCGNDDGKACERAVNIILGESSEKALSYKDDKEVIVMYGGGFYNNGITKSLINLSKQIDYSKYHLVVLETERMNAAKINNLRKLDSNARIVYKFSYSFRTFLGTYNQNMYWRQGYKSKFISKKHFKEDMRLEFKRLFGGLKADIFVDFGGYNKVLNALVAFSEAGKKSVYLHALMLEEYNKKAGQIYKHRWNLKVIFSAYNQFDTIITVSESTNEQNKTDLKEFGVNVAKMKYVDNIIDDEEILEKVDIYMKASEQKFFESSEDHLLRMPYGESINKFGVQQITTILPPEPSKIKFVHVGRLSPEKNQMNLIKAFSIIHEKYSNTSLYIVGDGPLADSLLSYTHQEKLSESVRFYGFLENPLPIINMSDCFVFPSNYEGQGIALMEAMILKKPVIGTNVTGIKSVLKDYPDSLVENTIEDIAMGMERYIKGQLTANNFDSKLYNQKALEMFYRNVC